MPRLALLLVCAACADGPGAPDVVVRGVSIWRGGQDLAGVETVLADCDARLTLLARPGLLDGAWAVFRPHAEADCGWTEPIAGCWIPDADVAVVEERASVAETALCHEMTHRARSIALGDADAAHADRAWWE